MTNDIRILSVLRKYYEEKALSTNSQEDADIHNALLHAIKALESTIHFPSNATNGDVIKAVFPDINGSVITDHKEIIALNYKEVVNWWNAPYREGDKND